MKEKETNYAPNGKVMIVHSIVRLIKTLYKTSQYFRKPYGSFKGSVKVDLDLSSYATRADLKNATGVDTSKLAIKSDLASLKA